jgi:hypothetical protein
MIETFRPLLEAALDIDLGDARAAELELGRRWDPKGDPAKRLKAELVELLEQGQLAQRGALPVKWGRVCKASPTSNGYSIDVVLMSGPGPRHRHPNGEIDYCIALDGAPTFDGRPAGWIVKAKGSTHVPTVEGGTMLIVYFLPDSAIEFLE